MEHAELDRNADIEHVLDAIDDAVTAFVDGRPEAFLEWWTQSDAVSLAGGLGGPIAAGQDAVRSRLEHDGWRLTQSSTYPRACNRYRAA